tara:strand:+ start:294 stop:1433 length:1140 start_codon:yes stop_codon:yes gene_type:complete
MRQFKLDKIKTTGTTVGDLYFSKVTALLPFDGTNGATSTTDSSNSNHTVTFGGDAEISTAQSKFGGSSLSLDGNGDYVDLPQSTNQFVSDDFTIEFWFRINSGAGSETVGLFGSYYTVGGGKGIIMASHPSYPSVYFQWMYGSGSGTDWAYLNKTQGTRTSLSNNTWYHVAVTRSGNTWRLFLNGTQEDSVTQSDQMTDAGSTTRIGNYGPSATATDGLDGYIEDFRITKGLARYTSNFTAPTSANLTSAGDVNKHIVVNSDADGIAIGTGGISQARIAKAWVNFNGTGTVAIRTSYNVSSITDDGTGKYDVNFSTAMSDNDYSVVSDGRYNTGDTAGSSICSIRREALTTSKFGVRGSNPEAQTFSDFEMVSAIVFGN